MYDSFLAVRIQQRPGREGESEKRQVLFCVCNKFFLFQCGCSNISSLIAWSVWAEQKRKGACAIVLSDLALNWEKKNEKVKLKNFRGWLPLKLHVYMSHSIQTIAFS